MSENGEKCRSLFPKTPKMTSSNVFFLFFVYSTNIFCSFSKRSKAEIRELWLFSIKKICSNQINELCCVTLRGVSTLLSTCMCSLVSYDFLVRGCNLNLWTQYSSNSDLTVRLISVRWHHNKMNAFTELGNLNLAWNSRPSRQQWKLPQR